MRCPTVRVQTYVRLGAVRQDVTCACISRYKLIVIQTDIISSDNCRQSLPVGSLKLQNFAVPWTRVPAWRRNTFTAPSIKVVCTDLTLSAIHRTEKRGPRLTVERNSGECCAACSYAKRSEWAVLRVVWSNDVPAARSHSDTCSPEKYFCPN